MSAHSGAGFGRKRGNSEHMSAVDNLESPARAVLLSRDSIEKLGTRRLAQLLLSEVTRNDGLLDTLKKAISDNPRKEIVSQVDLRRNEPVMVGSSPELLSVFKMIRKFAANEAPVLITGESGTGKELVAQAIHERSSYANGPFNPINCGGIPASLIASELFGHERGSFTGAHERKIGRIESAAGGTVFLDEIGELPLDLQANLLRFLQEKTIDRIGAQRPIKVDVRVLAATNKNLAEEVRAGRFREDLYYRLNVLEINLPPLRERGEDVDLLCSYFLREFAAEMKMSELRLSGSALAAIRSYSWPGNVRELISRLRRAAVMADSEEITSEELDLPAPLGGYRPDRNRKRLWQLAGEGGRDRSLPPGWHASVARGGAVPGGEPAHAPGSGAEYPQHDGRGAPARRIARHALPIDRETRFETHAGQQDTKAQERRRGPAGNSVLTLRLRGSTNFRDAKVPRLWKNRVGTPIVNHTK